MTQADILLDDLRKIRERREALALALLVEFGRLACEIESIAADLATPDLGLPSSVVDSARDYARAAHRLAAGLLDGETALRARMSRPAIGEGSRAA